MPRRSRTDVNKIRESLQTVCTECGHSIAPIDLIRVFSLSLDSAHAAHVPPRFSEPWFPGGSPIPTMWYVFTISILIFCQRDFQRVPEHRRDTVEAKGLKPEPERLGFARNPRPAHLHLRSPRLPTGR